MDTTIVPFLNSHGKPYQYVAIRSDITDRKKGEEELKKTLKEISDYKYALDESAIVAITDQKGVITHVNDNFCRISKYTAKELIGQDHRIINSEYHPKAFIKELWATIANGKVWKGELKNKAKDGTVYWVDTTIVPFLNPLGKPYQYVAIRSDITERKKGEEQIRQNNEKALQHAQLVELKNLQLIDFCNIVSHNLRAPLINISMLVDYIEHSRDEDERKEVLAKIKPVVNHLMEVFNELVESIQVKQDTAIEIDRIVLKDCLDKVLIGFETQIKEYGAKISFDFSAVSIIHFPQKYIESILTNLISNALKYRSPERKPAITIKTAKGPDDTFLLTVTDNGLGIDLVLHKDQIFKIRKIFHKHPDAKGFGLFMTKTHVDAMAGKSGRRASPGKEAPFLLNLKIIEMNRIKTLTLIDDDDVFVFLTTRAIQQTNLVDLIKVFENGLDALNFLKENQGRPDALPEVILLDLSMPIMNGWQFLEEYAKLNPTIGKSITIYICSSSISPDDVARAKSINEVSDYIIKPITKDKLVDLIKKL